MEKQTVGNSLKQQKKELKKAYNNAKNQTNTLVKYLIQCNKILIIAIILSHSLYAWFPPEKVHKHINYILFGFGIGNALTIIALYFLHRHKEKTKTKYMRFLQAYEASKTLRDIVSKSFSRVNTMERMFKSMRNTNDKDIAKDQDDSVTGTITKIVNTFVAAGIEEQRARIFVLSVINETPLTVFDIQEMLSLDCNHRLTPDEMMKTSEMLRDLANKRQSPHNIAAEIKYFILTSKKDAKNDAN